METVVPTSTEFGSTSMNSDTFHKAWHILTLVGLFLIVVILIAVAAVQLGTLVAISNNNSNDDYADENHIHENDHSHDDGGGDHTHDGAGHTHDDGGDHTHDDDDHSHNNSPCSTDSSRYLVNEVCNNPTNFATCFELVEKVESIAKLKTNVEIYSIIAGLEPQNTSPLKLWAVVESVEPPNIHEDFGTIQAAQANSNDAMYYNVRVQRDAGECGGWSLGFWKELDSTKKLQLSYCTHADQPELSMRICGSFDLLSA